MKNYEIRKKAMEMYIEGFAQKNPKMVIDLFADDATVEDPVGSPVISGKTAIAEFYERSMTFSPTLHLDAAIRGSHGDAMAMAFTVKLVLNGTAMEIYPIDVMTFNDDNKITSMKAYWAQEDMKTDI